MSRTLSQTSLTGSKARGVYLALQEALARGTYPEGSVLPGEQKLAAAHGVSRVTIRRALAALESDGFITRHVGRGAVVRSFQRSAAPMAADMATLMPQLCEMADRTEARLLSFSYGPAPSAVAQALNLSDGQTVQVAVRVRAVAGRPFSYLTTHVPESIAASYSEADLATTPLFRLLERGGHRIESAEQSVTAALATPAVASALGLAPGAALLCVERVVRDAAGRGVEHLTALYRPDLYRLSMRLHRVGGQDDRHWEPVIAAEGPSVEAAE